MPNQATLQTESLERRIVELEARMAEIEQRLNMLAEYTELRTKK